ncbi:phosphomannomutase/phosphoglucomutase [Leptospirillum ferriphilum]|jgi:phosphomannomutase/phosphoglucomutase|uniref:Phosphomannomutase n=2 Tax=Leptospirillum ferriphilum TaxID=178606 RepID=A0A059XYG2_9BACT|nr:phosphomannomutase/phosphoglucomutase [Leptospirillum ferriphilum]AFS53252.1 phosphomannomutase [Leptospirillum ferriphilum ML-04]AIA30306.1 phosphomannomutase [Leptospirillum ferriphilum YSK]MCL5259741.1 phosphomannomutase/phosphoglucomutase [Nitrospirota bacterium]
MIHPDPKIFREYDIRGNADRDLSDATVYAIGKAYASLLKESGGKRVALGQDVRLSSPRIARSMEDALLASGVDVLDVGKVPTPLLYFSLFKLPVDGGIMITGSHNPAADNGIKMAIGKETIFGSAIQEIRKRTSFAPSTNGHPSRKGVRTNSPIRETYLSEMAANFGKLPLFHNRPLRVVLDCGNGTAGLVAQDLFSPLGIELHCLYQDPDGHFPHHHPDPTVPENLSDLIAHVKKNQADLGIAFDGDSDRIGVVTESGHILFGDQLLLLFAQQVLESRPGSVILSEVKASRILYDEVARMGGKPLMWKAGHSLIKAKMKETKAPLAGEMSGHIFFADRYYGYDDALYAGIRLLELLTLRQKTLSELLAPFPKAVSTPEIRRDSTDDRKFLVVSRLREILLQKNYTFSDIDGVRIDFSDGWGLVRASNTQPVLVLRFEGPTPQRRDAIQQEIEALLSEAEKTLPQTS